MKISILLPYKENFSKLYSGAVSIFISDIHKESKYRKTTKIYGNTNFKNYLSKNYHNIKYKKGLFQSSSKEYIKNYIKIESKNKSDIIEIHNRPSYISDLIKLKKKSKLVLYFHNDPLEMSGSKTPEERLKLISVLDKIIFNSEWSKKRFLTRLNLVNPNIKKFEVIKQSVNPKKINFKKKKNTIIFVGKLNKAKGYDLFGDAICKILNNHKDWNAIVAGDEPREKLNFNHQRLKILGFQPHEKILKLFEKSAIAVVCSRWEEPFGRTSLEASSRGCAIVISDKGGLTETTKDAIILKELNKKSVYSAINKLITDPKKRKRLQIDTLKNFYLSNSYISNKIDNYRTELTSYKKKIKDNKLKILHITNFNERHNGRLFYNTGIRINNGFIRLNHSVLTISDRDIISYNRSITDIDGSKFLNEKLIKTSINFKPDLLVLGHADLIKSSTLNEIRKILPNIKIIQWFLDKMNEEWKSNKKRFLDKIQFMDASFCTTHPSVLNIPRRHKVYFIPNPSDPSLEDMKVYKNNNFNTDVFFAMSHGVHRGILKKGKHDKREEFIKKLIKLTPNTKFEIFGVDQKQPIWSDKFKQKLSESKMAINLSQGLPSKYYSSDRIVQLIGNGVLTFIDKKTKLDDFFSKKEVIFYNSIEDLSKKIIFYSQNNKERKIIAKNGRNKYHKDFSNVKVAKYMLSKCFNFKQNKFLWDK